MRFRELVQAIQESMSFSAGAKGKDGMWRQSIESADRYHPDVYKADYPYDADPKPNPDYKPELDLTLANANMRQVMDELGYPTDLEDSPPFPIDEFIARTTQWLQKHIDKPSPEVPTTVDKNPGGPTMYSGGREEGYMNQMVKAHNELARKTLAKYPEITHFGFN